MFIQIVATIYLVFTVCLMLCKLLSMYLLILTTVLFAAEKTDTERLSQCHLKCRLNKLEPECKSMHCFFHQEVLLKKKIITKYIVNSVFHNIVNLHSGTNSVRTSRRSLSLNSTGLHNLPKVTGRIRIYSMAFWL